MDRFVVMGVSGCGKSSIGAAFAQSIGGRFTDGDDLHSEANRAKMAAGHPLTDADRAPWLRAVGRTLAENSPPTVIGCSALKRAYRDLIRAEAGHPVRFLHLFGTRAVLETRMAARKDHFMPVSLLDSQLATLEPPGPDEDAITVNIDQTPDAILGEFLALNGKAPK